jgi:hypothetical protein
MPRPAAWTGDPYFTRERLRVSEQKPITKVPEGRTRFYTTRQKAPNEKGFVGYETVWKPFQKEVQYQTPKKP